ncbi:hypothetical protein FHT19_003718 [Novosphingobium sp. SG919]|nr:hypothetical protein [Novosphingobium sp. SG919]
MAPRRSRASASAGPRLPRPMFGAKAASGPVAEAPAPTPAQIQAPPPRAAPADKAQAKAPRAPADHAPSAKGAPLFDYDDELVLQMRTEKGGFEDTVIAYGTRAGVYLPLGALARFLDLPIRVSDEGHFASGWFLAENRTLSVDLRQGKIAVAGKERATETGEATAFDGELYVRADRVATLLPLEARADLRDQSLVIRTHEPFPFEQRLAREAERERLAGLHRNQGPQHWPREETPWLAASVPSAEAELRAVSDDQRGTRGQADLRLAGDLAWMTAQAYASLDSAEGLVAARVEMGRRDPDGQLLGPLRATGFALGDVASMPMAIGLRGVSGRGVAVTNAPIEQTSVFDTLDLRGPLLAGYEVELYRNGILVGSTAKPVNGQYEFLAVPVDFGLNVLRLVFYGPQGQRREEVRRISVGDGRLSPGQFVYSLAALQNGSSVLGAHGAAFQPGQDYGRWRAGAQLGWGINPALTVLGGLAWFDGDAGRNYLASLGLRTGIGPMALRADAGIEKGGAYGITLAGGARVLGLSFTAAHSEYRRGFVDEVQALSAQPLRAVSEAELSGQLVLSHRGNGLTLPLAARWRMVDHLDGQRDVTASLRSSLARGGVLVSSAWELTSTSAPGMATSRQLLASFDLATLSGSRWQVRAGLGTRVLPRPAFASAAVEVNRRIGEQTLVAATASHAFDNHQTQLGVSAIRRLPRLTIGFDAAVGFPDRSYAAMVRLGFSIGRNPLDGRLFLARPGLASSGAVMVHAFRDNNGNGRHDDGEPALPGAAFTSGADVVQSDRHGQAFLGQLGSGTRTSVQVDIDSLPDIALAPVTRGVEVVPRPGRIHVSHFAIQALSEIEGTARFASAGSGRRREVSGLAVQLVDAKGTVVAQVRSEADGFYLFEQVRPGTYRLRVDPDQVRRYGLVAQDSTAITVTGDGRGARRDLEVSAAH